VIDKGGKWEWKGCRWVKLKKRGSEFGGESGTLVISLFLNPSAVNRGIETPEFANELYVRRGSVYEKFYRELRRRLALIFPSSARAREEQGRRTWGDSGRQVTGGEWS